MLLSDKYHVGNFKWCCLLCCSFVKTNLLFNENDEPKKKRTKIDAKPSFIFEEH